MADERVRPDGCDSTLQNTGDTGNFQIILLKSIFQENLSWNPMFYFHSKVFDITLLWLDLLQNDTEAANKNLMGSQVCISVGVIRASGLKVWCCKPVLCCMKLYTTLKIFVFLQQMIQVVYQKLKIWSNSLHII